MAYAPIDLTPYTKDKEIVYRFYSKITFCEHGKRCNKCCWLYKGGRNRNFHICWLSYNPRKSLQAICSRFMYTIRYGHTDKLICHTCDILACCNYNHMYAGTYLDNAYDAKIRGRIDYKKISGENHYKAKLTEDSIKHMFLLREQGLTQEDIGKIIGVARSYVSRILNGKRRII